MKINQFVPILFILLILTGCNPFPKKDAHPEVPLLSDLLKDRSKFSKVTDMGKISEIIFLKDDRILLMPDNSNFPFKITDLGGKVIIESKYDWSLPFYIDKKGDLYFNREKHFYPDYAKKQAFKTIVFQDSLDHKSQELEHLNDSLRFKAVDEYEVKLLKPFGLKPCEYEVANSERCNVFKIKNGALIVRQGELVKVEFLKRKKEVPKFDDDVLIAWKNGKLPSPVYLSYYETDDLKFKCDGMTYPSTVKIAGNKYLYLPGLGLYQIL